MLELIAELFSRLVFFTGSVRRASRFPEPLSAEEEAECISLMAGANAEDAEEARHKLIEHNLRLVAHITKKYASSRRDPDDIISIGTIGLIKAVSSFDVTKGRPLATYAAKCIDNEILMSLRSEKKTAGEVSLSEPLGTDQDGNEISLLEVLGSDGEEVADTVERTLIASYLEEAIMDVLTSREELVIRLRYGIPGGVYHAQREVALKLGISRSYVSRIEKRALEKLAPRLSRQRAGEADEEDCADAKKPPSSLTNR